MFNSIRSWFKPHDSSFRKLYRCQCGDLYWSDSPSEVRKKHVGHRHSMAMNATFWEFFKMKMGWIR
jgi:hypothetical protein